MAKNPVEKRVDTLRDLWLENTQDPRVRILVWRIPANADRMLQAFFEMQQHPGDWTTPDLFLRFDVAFDTGFGYSRALRQSLAENYIDSKDSLREQGVTADWSVAQVVQHDSASGTMAMLASFAQYHKAQLAHLRYVAAVLAPHPVSSQSAWEAWLDAALRSSALASDDASVRLTLVDTMSDQRWQALAQRHGDRVRVVEAPIDMFDIARETVAQSGGTGPTVAYRQLLTDVITLVEKGSATQTSARAEKAMQIAQREQWPDQQVVLHMAVAGAFLKEKNFADAIKRYRDARACATQAEQSKHPMGADLIMQTWFGEAGVWLVAKEPERAAQAYRSAAEQAQRVPNPMFEIEGFRMAGYCYAQNGQQQQAREHGALALRAAKVISPAERPLTTMPLVLQGLLRVQDPARTAKLERSAADYQAAVAAAHLQAEQQAAKLGERPQASDLEKIENAMHASFESSFQRQRQEREHLIAGGDEFFRKVVALARELLNPLWNGLPEVKHPLDKDVPEWSEPPQFTKLPDSSGVIDGETAVNTSANITEPLNAAATA
ncbi:hypothetical protein LT85_3559 [Collimonas arenae]|uniref:Uncharacterized protein n=1 Tax=Collimonas arenae TaxID=279058 RepID=A0A0A1FIM5_9BURK|nr:hypothetical protein [Collimonas arenae]AIY42717.1 hypothetical protein LT85_3559 [Collimonas arenae]